MDGMTSRPAFAWWSLAVFIGLNPACIRLVNLNALLRMDQAQRILDGAFSFWCQWPRMRQVNRPPLSSRECLNGHPDDGFDANTVLQSESLGGFPFNLVHLYRFPFVHSWTITHG